MDTAVKKRMAASQLRELTRASSIIAEMKRAASLRVRKDQTTSGNSRTDAAFLGSMSLLETRIRAVIMKVRR